ncbi:MAG: hypothetical protein GQ542_13635 [Desulforhopalus sp.]|nr:hypothetical protein [Desulforhopalus sp.]
MSTITSLGKDVNPGLLSRLPGVDIEELFKMKILDSFEQILQINDIVGGINRGGINRGGINRGGINCGWH